MGPFLSLPRMGTYHHHSELLHTRYQLFGTQPPFCLTVSICPIYNTTFTRAKENFSRHTMATAKLSASEIGLSAPDKEAGRKTASSNSTPKSTRKSTKHSSMSTPA